MYTDNDEDVLNVTSYYIDTKERSKRNKCHYHFYKPEILISSIESTIMLVGSIKHFFRVKIFERKPKKRKCKKKYETKVLHCQLLILAMVCVYIDSIWTLIEYGIQIRIIVRCNWLGHLEIACTHRGLSCRSSIISSPPSRTDIIMKTNPLIRVTFNHSPPQSLQ